MICPTEQEYVELAGDYEIVPVAKEVLADTETPVSVFARFVERDNVFLLESIEGGETWGRYSFVGVDPKLILDVDHSKGQIGGLDKLREVYRNVRVADVPGIPRFCGGAVGFIGYEAMSEFERMPTPKPSARTPSARSRFVQADRMIVFDNVRHTAKIIVCTRPGGHSAVKTYHDALADIEAIEDTLTKPVRIETPRYPPVTFESNMSREAFCSMVAVAKNYIRAGDVIQVVLSQKFGAHSDVSPLQLYRALRLLNPSPYTFFIKIGAQVLIGSSPEVMVRLTGNLVEVRPIAGTRPRGGTEQEDRKLADDLLSDEKEKAEHVMLVDLGRNDLGRVSEAGSVQVREYMTIERYSHVMHMVSHVTGVLRKEFDAYDVIRATFPAGTVTGAPKIRAMEIIHELEPEQRGVYAGAAGYVGYNGNMDMAITIRTIEAVGGLVSVQAGAGIVHDSVPEKEFEETCHKARGMQKAVLLAANGLDISASR